MFNLIKMDLYRLIHSASTWILIAFTVLAAIFSIAMTDMDIQASLDNPAPAVQDTSQNTLVGIYVTENPEWAAGKIELGDVVSMEVQSGLTAILCVIFAALFANADQKNGYIKNIAGQFPGRAKLVLSKSLVIAVQVFVILSVFCGTAAAFSFLFWGSKVYLASLPSLLKVFGVQYLLHSGTAALIMFFTVLTKSTAFGSTAGILICSGLTTYLYSGINQAVSAIRPEWNFDISNYMLESSIRLTGIDSVSDVMVRGTAVGAVFITLSIALAVITMKKRDIR